VGASQCRRAATRVESDDSSGAVVLLVVSLSCDLTGWRTGSIPGVCDRDFWFHQIVEAIDNDNANTMDTPSEGRVAAADQTPAATFISKNSMQAVKYVPRAGWAIGLGLLGLIPVYFPVIAAVAAIVLGWLGRQAYVRSGKVLQRNAMATAGLLLGIVGLVLNGGLFAFNQFKSDSEFVIPPTRFHDTNALVAGICYGPIIADRPNVLEITDCAELHRSEVISRVTLVGDEYPGADAVGEQAFDLCFEDFARIVGIDPTESVYSVGVYTPSAGQWATNKSITCVVSQSNGELFTGSVVGSGQ
jgi:hypothetical protein